MSSIARALYGTIYELRTSITVVNAVLAISPMFAVAASFEAEYAGTVRLKADDRSVLLARVR